MIENLERNTKIKFSIHSAVAFTIYLNKQSYCRNIACYVMMRCSPIDLDTVQVILFLNNQIQPCVYTIFF